jgi:uncharacterized metal-binding protein (TIGR02443 family)
MAATPKCPKCGGTEFKMRTVNGITHWNCSKCGYEMASADRNGRIT